MGEFKVQVYLSPREKFVLETETAAANRHLTHDTDTSDKKKKKTIQLHIHPYANYVSAAWSSKGNIHT